MTATPKTFSVGSVVADVVPESEIMPGTIMVCMGVTRPLLQADNLTGPCVECRTPLQWHPSSPKAVQHACVTCAQRMGLFIETADIKTTERQIEAFHAIVRAKAN